MRRFGKPNGRHPVTAEAAGAYDKITPMLLASPLFRDLGAEIIAEIRANMYTVELARGETLFGQDDPATAFYVIVEGWVKVFRITPPGDEAVIGIFAKGESFAEIAALARGNYPASAEAVTNASLAAIPVDCLLQRISENPQVALTMLASVSRQVRRLVDEIEQMKALSGIQRVAEFLIAQSPVEEGACVVRLPYEKALIAGKLGMKAESLSRVFHRLRGYGVAIRGDTAMIDEVGALRKILEKNRGSAITR